MATSALSLVNGIPRMVAITASEVSIYDETLTVVQSSPGPNQIAVANVATGVPITLPNSGSYNNLNLEIYLNGNRLDDVFDYNILSSTQFSFTFSGAVGDSIRMRVDRGA
jgi:hypothetical protein